MFPLTRRRFLTLVAGAAGGLPLLRLAGAESSTPLPPLDQGVSFFFVTDTHYLANREQPTELDATSREYNARLIETLNTLPGKELPPLLGAGELPLPKGVIHGGDLIDSGDKNGVVFEEMQRTEFAAFAADYGLNGGDGRLRYPVREVYGNHDSPRGHGQIIEALRGRNATRANINGSPNGQHFSWDWGHVHFVNLGIVVGQIKDVHRPRRYAPLESLDFLIADLAAEVGSSGRPIVLTHHVDVARYCTPIEDPERVVKQEWDFADVRGYYEALRGYHIAAILYGHTHVRRIFRWDGQPPVKGGAPGGIPVFNGDNAAHFKSETQAFFHFQVTEQEIIAREFSTRDAWQSGSWTPEVWRFPLRAQTR